MEAVSLRSCIYSCFHWVILSSLLTSTCGEDSLILLQALWRHGDRSPVSTFPTNPVNLTAWPQGLGQLTQQGMRQHYELGQKLRQRYILGQPYKLLSSNYSRVEVTINSTDYDRTLMSAYSNLAGLYPPEDGQVWLPSLKWQPIPVHTKPLESDHILYLDNPCPTFDELYHKMLQSPAVKKEEAENADFYQFLAEKSGLSEVNIESVWEIYDTLFCEAMNNHPLPQWATQKWRDSNLTVMDKMRRVDAFQFDVKFDHPVQRKLTGGFLLKTMIENMEMKVNGSLDSRQRAYLFSAHDTTVAALLSALQVFNRKMPPYAACVLVELHSINGSHAVRVLYKDSVEEPRVLPVQGCADFCPLDQFLMLTKSNLPGVWEDECGLKGPFSALSKENLIILVCLVTAALTTLVAIVVITIYKKKFAGEAPPYYGLNADA